MKAWIYSVFFLTLPVETVSCQFQNPTPSRPVITK